MKKYLTLFNGVRWWSSLHGWVSFVNGTGRFVLMYL